MYLEKLIPIMKELYKISGFKITSLTPNIKCWPHTRSMTLSFANA